MKNRKVRCPLCAGLCEVQSEASKKRMESFLQEHFPLEKMADFTKIMALQTAAQIGYQEGMKDPEANGELLELLSTVLVHLKHPDQYDENEIIEAINKALSGETKE